MTRRKTAEQGDDPAITRRKQKEPAAQTGEVPNEVAAAAKKQTWLARFPALDRRPKQEFTWWDRQNRRLTIKFDEKPSAAVRGVIAGRPVRLSASTARTVW